MSVPVVQLVNTSGVPVVRTLLDEPANYALTDASTVVIDATRGKAYKVTLGGNRTIGNPTGAYDGQLFILTIVQDGTGSRTYTLGSKFRVPAGIDTTQSTGAGVADKIAFQYDSTADKFDVLAFQAGYV